MSRNDIAFAIEFANDSMLRAGMFSDIVATIDSVIYEHETRQLEQFAAVLTDIPTVALDAARHRIRQHKGNSLLVVTTRPGSLIIEGLVAGVALFVLKQTIFETLKDTWIDSPGHRKLKRLLLSDVSECAREITQTLKRKLLRKKGIDRLMIEIVDPEAGDYSASYVGSRIRVIIQLVHDDDTPPPRGVLLDEYENIDRNNDKVV